MQIQNVRLLFLLNTLTSVAVPSSFHQLHLPNVLLDQNKCSMEYSRYDIEFLIPLYLCLPSAPFLSLALILQYIDDQ